MNTIGSRIKEERERLGLSQEAFGKLGGVKKLAQLNYEKGNRQPGGEYLNLLYQHDNIDLDYIIHGLRRSPELDLSQADKNVLESLAVAIGIDSNDIYNVCKIALSEEMRANLGKESDPNKIHEAVRKIIPANLRSAEVDIDLLTEIIEKIEDGLQKFKYKLSPSKKSQVVAMLYRVFLESGKVDQKMIEESISIANK